MLLKNYERLVAGIEFKSREENCKNFNPLKTVYMNVDTYIDSKYYFEQIKRHRQYFPDEQIQINFFEDLVKKPHEIIAQLRQVIDLTGTYSIDLDSIEKNMSAVRLSRELPTKMGGVIREILMPNVNSKLKKYCTAITRHQRPEIDDNTKR